MAEKAVDNILAGDEGVAAVLGLVILHQGGEVRIPGSLIEEGLPPNSGVRVQYDPKTDELVIDVAEAKNEDA